MSPQLKREKVNQSCQYTWKNEHHLSRSRHLPYERISISSRLFSSFLNIASHLVGVPASEYFGRWLGVDSLRSWFYLGIKSKASLGLGEVTYYEFGVGWGETLSKYIDALKAYCRETKDDIYRYHIFLFDSFEGLPPKQGIKDDHPNWGEGTFAHDVSEIQETITHLGIMPNKGNIHIVKGFFHETLTSELAEKLPTPQIITIDVDYYSSCKTVLGWLRPLLKDGTLFYFDNIWSFFGNPGRGELAAINEFNQKREGLLVKFPLLESPMISSHTYAFVEGTAESLVGQR
jgi:hypothetical protein